MSWFVVLLFPHCCCTTAAYMWESNISACHMQLQTHLEIGRKIKTSEIEIPFVIYIFDSGSESVTTKPSSKLPAKIRDDGDVWSKQTLLHQPINCTIVVCYVLLVSCQNVSYFDRVGPYYIFCTAKEISLEQI